MKKITLTLALALPAVFGFMALATPDSRGESPSVSPDTALARNIEIFNTITRYLAQSYVDSLRPDEAFKSAISGLLYTVDPYTEYYDAEEVERLEVITTGAYGGIGAYVLGKDGDTYISLPIEGTPSFKAGLKPGDRILRVDSVDVTGKPTDFTTRHLKGDPGTMVKVTVERPYVADSILTFHILREKVQEKSVPYYGVHDGVGYIKLTSFMEKSAQEVRKALEEFKGNPEVKGVVLDLRTNGGGLVASAVDILGMFFPKGTQVIETRGKTEDAYKAFVTSHSPLLPDMPLAILIDDGSASASEITAGAVQDLDRGVLVGSRSFGKGLVQGTLSLPYDGILKVTTAKYHLPSGRLIQALDYSKRRPDGSVAPTPDSLANEFKTRNGRIVKDGGGLVPDSTVTVPDISRVTYNLLMSNQIFDFATKFAAENPSVAAPRDFKVSDEMFEEFVAFVDTAKIKSDNIGERMLEEMKKTVETEGYLTDELKASLDSLAPMLAPDLRRDLYHNRDEISYFIGREILGRYYNRAGEIEFSLTQDPEFDVARSILLSPGLYDSLLAPAKEKDKKRGGRK